MLSARRQTISRIKLVATRRMFWNEKWRRNVKWLSMFIIARYPFVNALTFLMLLAERASWEDHPPIAPNIIYCHLAVFIICGVCMSFDMHKFWASLLQAAQVIVFAITIYVNRQLRYTHWLKMRLFHRMLGVSGFYVLFACVASGRVPRSPALRRLSETLVGLYLLCGAYMAYWSPDDRRAMLRLASPPLAGALLLAHALLLLACAACYLPGRGVHVASHLLLALTSLTTLALDCDLHYWVRQRGVHYWTQVRLVSDHACIIAGLVMLITCSHRVHFDVYKYAYDYRAS